MQHKIDEALNCIKKARDQSSKGNHVFARDHYITGIQHLRKISADQKDQNKKALIKGQMDIYLKQAEDNKTQMLCKDKFLGHSINSSKDLLDKKAMYVSPSQNQLAKKCKTIDQEVKQEKLDKKCLDKEVQQFILKTTDVSFSTIVGMKQIKKAIQEIILLPKKRPDLFKGIRAPPRGIILYGPPGNGKTFIAKAIATQSDCTFFNLSASSIMSKYVGDSERMLKKIFVEAYKMAPSIIFIDEIDSILTSRSQNQNQASRRLKTQFLVQMDGLTTTEKDSVLCIGATNLPRQLDKAALRRFPKKIFIGPPDFQARKQMLNQHMKDISHSLSDKDFNQIATLLDFYSASDIKNVCKEASMMPVRQVGSELMRIPESSLRKVNKNDYMLAIANNPATVNQKELEKYKKLQ